MCENLQYLIEQARHYQMSDAEREAQVRSFAYGNTRLENPCITRADIDEAAESTKFHQTPALITK